MPWRRLLAYITGSVDLGVPRSTAVGWLQKVPPEIVTSDLLSMREHDLQTRVVRLQRRVRQLRAVVRLLVALLHLLGVDVSRRRLPGGDTKSTLLRAIEGARAALNIRDVLRILGLSHSRHHAWRRTELGCDLDDQSSCPATSPHRLTADEVREIREIVTSPDFRHVPTGTLAILAQRLRRVIASPTTWRRLVRQHGWRRLRRRVHPSKPKVGDRAEKPDDIWHIDTTIIGLVDGTEAYVHAIIDNFSRRILSRRVAGTYDPANTVVVDGSDIYC